MKHSVIFSAISILALFSSCSLEEIPQGYVTRETFYKTEEQCLSALRAVYTPAHYMFQYDTWLALEACTDLWYSSSKLEDAQLEITPAKPGVGETMWLYGYKGVARANECVECITSCPLSEEVKMPLAAEARTLRAFYYYVLTSFFNGVPFYTFPVSDLEASNAVRNLDRTDASQIRRQMYADLKENALPYFTTDNGYARRMCEIENEHAGYALALMLMAKMAMWDKEWDDALFALDKLEELYGEFNESNYPLEEVCWKYNFSKESIFEIQHAWNETGAKLYGDLAGVLCAKCTGEYMYDGVYMPQLSKTGTSTTPIRCNRRFILFRSANNSKTENAANAQAIFKAAPMMFTNETYASGSNKRYCSVIDLSAISTGITANGSLLDKRILYTFGMGNLETGDTFTTLRTGSTFYGGPKFWCNGMTANYDSNNYRLFRYADAVLMQAECHCMKGDGQKAMDYLNKIRNRAGIAPVTEYSSEEEFLSVIQDERAMELGGEFHRKFDLVRWGIWYEQTKKHNNQSRVVANIEGKPYLEYYPIPDTECALSNGHLTNEAYEQ